MEPGCISTRWVTGQIVGLPAALFWVWKNRGAFGIVYISCGVEWTCDNGYQLGMAKQLLVVGGMCGILLGNVNPLF